MCMLSIPSIITGSKSKLVNLGFVNGDIRENSDVTENVTISDSADQMDNSVGTEEPDMATWLSEEPDISEIE